MLLSSFALEEDRPSDKNYNRSAVYNEVIREGDRSCFELYFEFPDCRVSSCVQ